MHDKMRCTQKSRHSVGLAFSAMLVHQILSSCCYFCFLFPSTALKFLAVAMAMSKCRTIGLPNHSDFAL